jgi:WD repeat-containing protein 76
MANTLEVFSSVAKATNDSFQPAQVIHHDNKTGRWLTTFQAVYHPSIEHLLAVGSMAKPRRLDIYDDRGTTTATTAAHHHGVSGEALTAVVSRLAFHPRTDRIIVAGGNSSGRVTIFR